MTKVQVYFLAACVFAAPHFNEWLALGLAVAAVSFLARYF